MDVSDVIVKEMVNAAGWQVAFVVILLLFVFAAIFGVIINHINSRLQAEIHRQERTFQGEIEELQKKLQAQLDRGTHVSKARFDKEFEMYQIIWSYVIKLQEAFENSAIKIVNDVDKDENEELSRYNITVGRSLTAPTADSEPDLRGYPHPAPREIGRYHQCLKFFCSCFSFADFR